MGAYTDEWNDLSVSERDYIYTIKELSFTLGDQIPFEYFSDKYVKVFNPLNGKKSIGSTIKRLYIKGYAESSKIKYNPYEVHCLAVTNKGIRFIFNHQDIIERWIIERKAYFSK